jgi:hypothetical protein
MMPLPAPARQVDHELRERRQVGAEALEQRLELRDHEDQQDHRDDDRDHQHRGRIEQRLLDLLLQRLGLFLVGRDLVEQVLERTGLLAGLDQVDVQVVEKERVLGERLVQRVPPSTSALMSRISFCIAGLSLPLPTISNDCTSGMPAASMVASWRLKTAMSSGLTLPPLLNS